MAERRPSGLRSLHSMRILDRQHLVMRMMCCAASDRFTEEEKGRVDTRLKSLRVVVTYSRFTVEMCLASAVTAAASIANVRASATLDDTGLAWSSDMVRRLKYTADDATSTKDGNTYLLPLTAVTSGPLPQSSEELELPAP